MLNKKFEVCEQPSLKMYRTVDLTSTTDIVVAYNSLLFHLKKRFTSKQD